MLDGIGLSGEISLIFISLISVCDDFRIVLCLTYPPLERLNSIWTTLRNVVGKILL